MHILPSLDRTASHIAIILHDFSTGGSERIAIRLANQWVRTGRKVTILCGVSTGPARAHLDPAVSVVGVWPEIRRSLLSRIVLGRALAECIALLEPDLIFVPGNFHIPVIAVLARLLGPRRPAIVCKLSNPLRRTGRPAPLQALFGMVVRRMLRPVDGIVAMAAALAEEARIVLKRSDIRLIHEPNIDAAHRPPRDIGLRDGRTIVCAGRLVPQKNFELAIQAFARIDRRLDARLLILGDGERRLSLETLVDRLGLNHRVQFAGHVPDIRPTLARASLFLLSSRYEGYPAVLIEALAAGVPVVATDCSPALAEIISEPAFGRIVEADPVDMAAALEAILRVHRPPIDAGRLMERHRADGVATRYLALFDSLVQLRPSSSVRA